MRTSRWTASLMGLGFIAGWITFSEAVAQEWVTLEDETDLRMISDPSVGSADPDEKDYAWADVDKDGDIDLVSVRKQEWTTTGRRRNVLFMNEGIAEGHAVNGVLVDRTVDYATASEVAGSQGFLDLTNDRDVALVDVDGDTWLDIVTSTTLSGDQEKYISHPRVYINLGEDENGDWQGFIFDDENRIATMPSEPRFCSIATGDIDEDGDIDIYFGDYQQGPYSRSQDLNDRLLINDGTGYFTDETDFPTYGRMTFEMVESSFAMASVMADMNGDGHLDILKDDALNSPQAVSVSYNNPDDPGYFDIYQIAYPNAAPYHIWVDDLNNDNMLDFIVSDDGSDRYVLNQGNDSGIASFSNLTFKYTGGESDDGFGGNNIIADLNNDGWKDVIITDVDVDISGCSRRTHIYRNLGDAPNVTLQEQTVGTNCGNPNSTTCTVGGIVVADLKGGHDAAVFDIDGDGWLDVVLGRCSSTEVYMNQPPIGLVFTYPKGLPAAYVTPDEETTFQVQVAGVEGGNPVEGSGEFYLSIDGGPFQVQGMTDLGDNLYEATLPAETCLTKMSFYFTAEEETVGTVSDPADAPEVSYFTQAALGEEITLRDEIEDDVSGWIIESDVSLTGGEWEQAEPNITIGACGVSAPGEDATAGDAVMAFVTENGEPGGLASQSDVDNGATYLTSPPIDLAGSDASISYARWFTNCFGVLDTLEVEVSNDDGATWVPVHSVTGTDEEWETVSFVVSAYVAPTDQVRVRFWTSDFDDSSLTEAGIDNFEVREILCPDEPSCEGDANGDGAVDPLDSGFVLARFGCSVGTGDADCDASDQNGDGAVDPLDVGFVLARFGDCE